MSRILDQINEPKDLKSLSMGELEVLSQEIRKVLIQKISVTGGHLGSNLGMVEATVAAHYVFESPRDKMVFDVSHQSYAHKVLTGRKEAFLNPEAYDTVSGYTQPEESAHDLFTIGHTSTSISLACGLAKARDLKGDKENIIAIIGDGSLSGGQAYEGLNNAAVMGSNMIIIVNDNDMAIAENHGGLYQNLARLRETKGEAEHNFFKALGFDYHYVEEGNSISHLIEVLAAVKDSECPVVVHIHTVKGKGFKEAEIHKEAFHWVKALNLEAEDPLVRKAQGETYTSIGEAFLIEKAKKDPMVVGITAATPKAVGFGTFRKEVPAQFVDVGIAEEHAIALASGLASQGVKPVASFKSTFIQRAYDQLSQDLALNSNPALIVVHSAGIGGGDRTHLGVFDISLIANIPNMVYLAPTDKEEYLAMMEWGLEQNSYPVAIRVPNMSVSSSGRVIEADFSQLNRYEKVNEGSQVAIIGLGSFYHLGKRVQERLLEAEGIEATLINPRFITGIDEDMLTKLMKGHQVVITLEDGILEGGFGEKISRFYADKEMRVLNFGANKEFTSKVPTKVLYERYRLTEAQIVEAIKKVL